MFAFFRCKDYSADPGSILVCLLFVLLRCHFEQSLEDAAKLYEAHMSGVVVYLHSLLLIFPQHSIVDFTVVDLEF